MTHDEIMKKWYWKRCQETASLWYQCVAWAKKYCDERWYAIGSFNWSAINWWKSWSPFDNSWKRVNKTKMNYPSEWDIVFFDWWTYGHVAVANKFCNPVLLRWSEQNINWTGSWLGKDAISPFWRSYSGCVGWFTRK